MTNRREFVIQISVAGSAMLAGQAMAQAPMVVETDAAAAGLGYKADTTKVDAKKYPQACRDPAVQQLCAVPGQTSRRGRWLPAVCRQAGRWQGLVQCLGQKGLISPSSIVS